MQSFSSSELGIFKKLSTPRKIQDYLDSLSANFCEGGHTCFSPRLVLRERKAHCIEGAMFAAAALRVAGYEPLVFELKSVPRDDDHVMALFKEGAFLGAISKTNHGVLRYREPVYKSLRELAMSFFHEYILDNGSKTMRSYSIPVNLSRFDTLDWMTSEKPLWAIPNYIDQVKHFDILTRAQIARLRKADPIECAMGRLQEWSKTNVRSRF